ncbi:MAG: hypothetical protein JXM70_05020 [Pirellulales bacterium]|nr:hypothetical protein [Pirellulales bacterium]
MIYLLEVLLSVAAIAAPPVDIGTRLELMNDGKMASHDAQKEHKIIASK